MVQVCATQTMQPNDNQAQFSQAIIAGDVAQIVLFLKDGTVDINHRDVTHDLETPLMSLCHAQFQTPDAIHQILAAVQGTELKINQKDALGRTLAMHACIAGNIVMLEFAIAQGCDIMITDRKGKNLIHHVAMTGSEVLVNVVLKHPGVGQALRTLDCQGYSPIDLARQKRHSAIARQLSTALQQGKRSENGHTTSEHYHKQNTDTSPEFTHQTMSSRIPSAPSNPSALPGADHHQSKRAIGHGYLWNNKSSDDEPMGVVPVTQSPMESNSQPPQAPRSVNTAATSDIHGNIPLARKESLRRSHIFRKPPEGVSEQSDTSAVRSKTPLPPCFDPKLSSPVAHRRILSQGNSESQITSYRPDPSVTDNSRQLVSSVSRSNPSTPKRVLFNNAVLRQTSFDSSGRASAALSYSISGPLSGHSGQNATRERPRSVLELQGFLSPRPIPKQIYSRNRLLVMNPQDIDSDGETRSRKQESRDKEDRDFGEGVLAGHEQCTPRSDAPSTSEEFTELNIKSTKSRHRQRRSSISLPDLRDMFGCLVTSNKTDTFSNLAVGRKSRVTLETVFGRGRVTDQQKIAGHDETNQHEEDYDSDVSLDSNFEDESPIQRS